MPTLREKLEARARRIELETTAAIEAYTGELDAFLYKWISRFYSVKLQGIKGALIIKQLPRALDEAGLGETIAKVSKPYSDKVKYVKEGFLFAGLETLDPITKALIVERVSVNVLALQNEVAAFVSKTQQAALSQLVQNQAFDFDEFSKIRQSPFLSKLTGEVKAGLNSFQFDLGLRLGEQLGIDNFYYAGTIIKTSRAFCIARVGRVFNIKEIRSWNNAGYGPGTGGPGGWNCLHSLEPVSDTQEKSINKVIDRRLGQ